MTRSTHLANSLNSAESRFFTTKTNTRSLRFRTVQSHTFFTLARFSSPQIPKITISAIASYRRKPHSPPPEMDPMRPPVKQPSPLPQPKARTSSTSKTLPSTTPSARASSMLKSRERERRRRR